MARDQRLGGLNRAVDQRRSFEEWSYDLDATLRFTTPAGPKAFRARFDLGLLQQWAPRSA